MWNLVLCKMWRVALNYIFCSLLCCSLEKLWSMGQIWPTVCFCKSCYIGTQPFVYLSSGCFCATISNWVVVTKSIWAQSLRYHCLILYRSCSTLGLEHPFLTERMSVCPIWFPCVCFCFWAFLTCLTCLTQCFNYFSSKIRQYPIGLISPLTP